MPTPDYSGLLDALHRQSQGQMQHAPQRPPSMNPMDAIALSTAAIPGVGDVTGLLADARRFAYEPESRTWGNAALSGLGLLPFVPSLGVVKALDDLPLTNVGKSVDGLSVGDEIKNTHSISASFNDGDYEILPGLREVNIRDFNSKPEELFYAADDIERTRKLAKEIKSSGYINPLIVVIDEEGKYILEGGHRLGALNILGKKKFPALVVKDLSQ